MKSEHQQRIERFMSLAKQELPTSVMIPSVGIRRLRARLILEEAMETIAGLGMGVVNGEIVESGECSLLEVVDGCCDVSVVTIGTLSAFGVDDSPVLKIVDEANLRKFGRGHSYRADGKLVKPADFVGPKSELEAFLNYRR